MENPIRNVSLSFCCKEDWKSFSNIDERTRFCGSCKHQVIDFTDADKATLERALKAGNRVCGRFKASQMSESFLKIAAASLMVAASATTIGCKEEIIEAKSLPVSSAVNEVIPEEMELMGDVELTGIILEMKDDTSVFRIDTLRSEK